ncbi:MAG: DUF5069 domain-containing protein [Candidatus Sericytochromatia bacterium]
MPTIQAKDLSKEFPRSPYADLAGIPWLPRLVDKVRALNAGTIGEYTPFPCGGDQRFLGVMGLDADAMKSQIASGASDDEIVAWVKANATPGYEGRMAEYQQGQFQAVTGEMAGYLAHAKEELAKARPELDLSGVTNFAQLICMEEGYPIPSA